MYNFDKKNFADILKTEIKKAGYTQEEFAEKCNISAQSLRDYLNPKKATTPNTATLCDIANTLNISIDELFNQKAMSKAANITPKDIVNAINLLLEAYGNETVQSHSVEKEIFDHIGVCTAIGTYEEACIYIDDDRIQKYLERIKKNGAIKKDLEAVDALDKYYELLERWADIDDCIFEKKHIYDPKCQKLTWNLVTQNYDIEFVSDDLVWE